MAVKKACVVANSVKNTGKECNIAMGPTAMIIPVPATLTFTIEELEDDILGWATPLMHGTPAARIYPLFGQKAPINTITNNAEADVIVTLDDGTPVYIRPGIYSRIYETISGGLCYAQSLASFLNSGMNIIEIDKTGQMLVCYTGLKNDSGQKLYRGLIPNFMYGLSPILADLKTTPFKNRFSYSFDPTEMVNNGEIFSGASPLLAVMGLIDSEITEGTQVHTTAHIFVGAETECAETNLVAQLGAALATHQNNFIVTHKDTGVVVTISAATAVGGEVQLAGTFVSANVYHVVGSAPSVWLGNAINGYDASENGVDITIP